MPTRKTSSTNPRQALALTRFYDTHLRPLSKPLAGEAGAHVHSSDGSTYFVSRSKARLDRSDFELPLGDVIEAAHTLELAWQHSRLRGLVSPLIGLVPLFDDVEERSDVSSSFYEMF